jgi:hypothetical protein
MSYKPVDDIEQFWEDVFNAMFDQAEIIDGVLVFTGGNIHVLDAPRNVKIVKNTSSKPFRYINKIEVQDE